MKATSLRLTILLLCLWRDPGVVLATETLLSEPQYMDNIRNYVDSLQTYRFKAEFKGLLEEGYEGIGQVKLDCAFRYDLLYDKKKDMWKVKSEEHRLPQGQFTEEHFNILNRLEKRISSKTRKGSTEYVPRDAERTWPNTVYLYGNHMSLSPQFSYRMQSTDPAIYIRKALPRKKCIFKEAKPTDNGVLLVYDVEGVDNGYRVVELSKEYGYLPVRIANEGEGWNDFRDGAYRAVYWLLEYEKKPSGYVVTNVSYQTKYGKGQVKYSDMVYNSVIDDREFEIAVPHDARIVDWQGRVISEGGSNIDNIVSEGITLDEASAPRGSPGPNDLPSQAVDTDIEPRQPPANSRDIDYGLPPTDDGYALGKITKASTIILGFVFIGLGITIVLFRQKAIIGRKQEK